MNTKFVYVGAILSLSAMSLFILRPLNYGVDSSSSVSPDAQKVKCDCTSTNLVASGKQLKPQFPVFFPPTCTDNERRLMEKRFPAGNNGKFTRCPDATWWDDYLYDEFFSTEYVLVPSAGETPSNVRRENVKLRPLVSIFCGCNKGDDAVRTLRKLTGDRRVDAAQFTSVMNDESENGVFGRACPERSSLHPLIHHEQEHPFVSHSNLNGNNNSYVTTDAHVYCIEALPLTARVLKASVDRFAWNDSFTVSHAAMGKQDGTVDFPAPTTGELGIESFGIADCARKNKNRTYECETVPLYSLDTYVRKFILSMNNVVAQSDDWVIDFLSVDVEGYDWDVLGLGGANETLKHVRYLEFEYHYVGNWIKYQLEDAVHFLKEYDFVCYYAGVGRLWRVTDCFLPYMNDHRWSNVACVNVRLQPRLAARMELLFKKELV